MEFHSLNTDRLDGVHFTASQMNVLKLLQNTPTAQTRLSATV